MEYGHPSYSVYGYKSTDLYNFAIANDYILCDLFGNAFVESDIWELCVDQFYWDYLLVPPEKLNILNRIRIDKNNLNKIPLK